MHYTTYLFDFDYTLADSSRGIVLCFRHVLERNGYTDVTDEAIRRTIGKTLEESFSILTGETDRARLADFKQQYRKEADVHMTPNTRLFPETLDVLRRLKERGAKVGIISTKYRFRIHDTLDQHLPADFLDIVVGGEDVARAKPDPEGLLHAITELGVEKTDVLYIGDSTVDAETALAAGVDFAGVTHGVTTADERSARQASSTAAHRHPANPAAALPGVAELGGEFPAGRGIHLHILHPLPALPVESGTPAAHPARSGRGVAEGTVAPRHRPLARLPHPPDTRQGARLAQHP